MAILKLKNIQKKKVNFFFSLHKQNVKYLEFKGKNVL